MNLENIKEEIEKIKKEIEYDQLILISAEDKELNSLAEEELKNLTERQKNLEKELAALKRADFAPLGREEPYSAIVEIRAGAGGNEAGLFAADLYGMYKKYAQLKGWKQKVLDSNPSTLGGLKEIIFELKGSDVFSKMKFEGGVHRVQRIPLTEKAGRVHTSTASVAVLPKPTKTEVRIRPEELKMDLYCASGPGGQYVQKRHTAVRLTHLPTGLVVTSQTERNQQQNRDNAMSILEAKLLEKKIAEQTGNLGEKRRLQIGEAKRAEKIRTYNFPQDRVTDHRIKKSWHSIESIMDGQIDSIIEALQSA